DALAPHQSQHPDVPMELVLVAGEPAATIAGEADGAGLLVTGSRGHGGFAGLLLGSVSRRLLQTAPCAVAVVRPAGWSRAPAGRRAGRSSAPTAKPSRSTPSAVRCTCGAR